MYISAESEGDYTSALGMQQIEAGKVAELMGVANKIHQESDHPSIPGLKIGQLGGPIWELVQLITKVMNETGGVLIKGGYPNLGAFVLEALQEGEKAKDKGADSPAPECEVILERVRNQLIKRFGCPLNTYAFGRLSAPFQRFKT